MFISYVLFLFHLAHNLASKKKKNCLHWKLSQDLPGSKKYAVLCGLPDKFSTFLDAATEALFMPLWKSFFKCYNILRLVNFVIRF